MAEYIERNAAIRALTLHVCKIGFESRTDFCPHCGAKMDEEVEDAK